MENNEKKVTVKDKRPSDSPSAAVFGEFLFVILPLIVVFMVRIFQGKSSTIIYCPEIAFGAAILFGQSIIKIVAAVGATSKKANWQNLVAVISGLIVLGLVPSLTILGIILMDNNATLGKAITQLVLFLLSSISLFTFGAAGQQILVKQTSIEAMTTKKPAQPSN